jgi:hypothetical protein
MSTRLRDRVEGEANRILRDRVERLRLAFEEVLSAVSEPLSFPLTPGEWGAAGGAAKLQVLRDAVDSISRRETQRDILSALIDAGAAFYPRAALFIVKAGMLTGWAGLGFLGEGGFRSEHLPRVSLSAAGDHILARAVSGQAAARSGAQGPGREVHSALGGVAPGESSAVPVLVRGRPVAVLYGDTGSAAERGDPLAFEIVARIAGLAMERLAGPHRRAHPAPVEVTATLDEETPHAAPAAAPGAPAPPEEAELQAILADLGGNLRTPAADDGQSDEERRRQADARRFAHLLVSELLLYNEAAVIQGRKHHDLHARLQKEIERSRQAFVSRFPGLVSGPHDYFRDELVRLLAQGDPGLLGN